jgi:hypothetical protein
MLHMTRIAFGCDSLADLVANMASRSRAGRLYLTTRYRPKRAEEVLDGGSLYWIVKHQLVARAPVLGFEATGEGRCHIVLDATPRLVVPLPRRAHQGWRYLLPEDAPPDLGEAGEGAEALPAELTGTLGDLGLL